MKTDKEMLDFYEVEVGKTYIVTKVHDLLTKEFENQQFKVYKDRQFFDGFLVVFENNKGNTERRLSCLRNLDYEEIKPEILDKQEKEYLTNIIKPFKNKVDRIYKREADHAVSTEHKEFICIEIEDDASICLPNFNKGLMYKGMEIGKKYTLKDLGL